MNARTLLLIGLLVAVPVTAGAQTPPSPFLGSAPPAGPPSPQPVRLSLKDAVTRALQYNLGLLLQEASVTQARGARWRALEDLLPNLATTLGERRTVINLAVFGFQADPSIIGPFNVFDARVGVSQPVFDVRALNDYRAAALNEKAEKRGVKSARDLVVLVAVNLYLEAVTAANRIELTTAQLETAQALGQQAIDLKTSGLVANVDVLRAQVQIQNQRQRSIVAENDLAKARLRLARAIGLPPGQDFALTDTIPFAPLDHVTVADALARAYDQRADFLAARDRVAAAEATRRAAGAQLLPTLNLDADYGTIGQTTSDAHPTYAIAATVRIPLFEAGRAQARRAEGDALLQRRRAELEDIKGQVDLDVRTSLLDVRAAAQQLEAAQTTVALANQELEQARDRFAAGVTSNIEVTQAQETVAAASDTYLSALYAHNLAKASLARASGVAETAIMQYLGGVQ
ncbi:MAG: TolC family protein [Vicinamibacterales bacterium]